MGPLTDILGLLLLLVAAALATIPFRTGRRYLLLVIAATVIGAWFQGYVLGARSEAQLLRPFFSTETLAQADKLLATQSTSPYWGIAFSIIVIVAGFFVFRDDIPPQPLNDGDTEASGERENSPDR